MKALDRKIFRDLLQMKGQMMAISLVVACGIATFVMSLSTVSSLERALDTYYERHRFADVFTQLKRAPGALADQIAGIPGVARVDTRLQKDVTLSVSGLSEPAIGRIISLPDYGEPPLNRLHLRAGRYPDPAAKGEVLAGEAFTDAHGFMPGDYVHAILNGKQQRLVIVGIALSPEYVYQIMPGNMIPDDVHFGVFWMPRSQLAAAFDMEGAFNSVTLALAPGASQTEVVRRLDDLTKPYGGIGAHGREDQTSHSYVVNEFQQLRSMASVPPVIFLAVSAFLLNMAMARLVNIQRRQIAALKSFGYFNSEIILHYIKLVAVVVVVGVLLGMIGGSWLGKLLTGLYMDYFRFPVFHYRVGGELFLWSVLISMVMALLGVYQSIHRAAALPPAEAMRPEPPARYRPTLFERLGLQAFFGQPTRMILRQLERRPVKAVFSGLGIALAAAIFVMGSFTADVVDYLLEDQFHTRQRYDADLLFVEPTTAAVTRELQQLPGVMHCEVFRTIPVRLRHEHFMEQTSILGLPEEHTLMRLLDKNRREAILPVEGVLISQKLAKALRIAVGQRLQLEVLEGKRTAGELAVVAIVDDYIGKAAYMRMDAMNRFLQESRVATGAYLQVDSRHADALYATLKTTPRIAGVNIKDAVLANFKKLIDENMLLMRLFNVIFASIIAFGVVYNNARITLSERSRELATMRVIGFTVPEISAILLGEIAAITAVALPLGLCMGYGLARWMVALLENELFSFPFVIHSSTYGSAVLVVVAASVFSGFVVQRRLRHLDLVSVLKSEE